MIHRVVSILVGVALLFLGGAGFVTHQLGPLSTNSRQATIHLFAAGLLLLWSADYAKFTARLIGAFYCIWVLTSSFAPIARLFAFNYVDLLLFALFGLVLLMVSSFFGRSSVGSTQAPPTEGLGD